MLSQLKCVMIKFDTIRCLIGDQLLLRDMGTWTSLLSNLRDVGLVVRMWLHMDDDDDCIR